MNIKRFDTNTLDMPTVLRRRIGAGGQAPVSLLGDPGILGRRLIGFFCSVRCSGDVILKTFDLARSLRGADVTFVGGFQSPMEIEFQHRVLLGSGRVVVCPARGLGRMRILKIWNMHLNHRRLMFLSFFDDRVRRPTVKTATERNARVVDLVDVVLIAHAERGRKTEALCREATRAGKPVFALVSNDNAHLFEIGARPLFADDPGVLIKG